MKNLFNILVASLCLFISQTSFAALLQSQIEGGGSHTVVLSSGSMTGWGNNAFGQLPPITNTPPIIAVSAGDTHTLAVSSDGKVLAFGENLYGQITVPLGLTGVTEVAAGSYHSLALKNDGTVVAWGDNSFGQGAIPAGLSGVIAIAAGTYHSLALKNDGTVVAWGDNTDFNGAFIGQATVPVGLTGVIAIGAGVEHSIALKNDGTVVGWGGNSFGQSAIPVGLSGVTAIAVGAAHNVALIGNGTLVIWGDNSLGQATVPVAATGVVAIGAGDFHSLAITANNSIIAWGDNTDFNGTFVGQATVPVGLTIIALELDSDNDRVPDVADAFPNDTAASIDTDGDGYPDAWNVGKTVADSTSIPALALDAFPNDPTLWLAVDVTPPVFQGTPLADIVVQATGVGTVVSLITPIATDANAVTVTSNAPVIFPLGITVVTWTATDASGNISTAVQNVIVQDTTAPVITLNGTNPVTIEVGSVYIDANATVTDNVDATNANLIGISTVNTGLVGSYTVTYNYMDGAGNSAIQVIRTVHVVDTTAPVIIPNGANPVTVEAGTVYTDANATVTDNVDATNTNLVGVGTVNTGLVGSYTVTYNHTDVAGNTAVQVVRTVNVVDSIAPVITLNGTVSVTLTVGTVYTDAGASAVDTVDGDLTASIRVGGSFVDTSTAGTFTMTYDVTDSSGNAAIQVVRSVIVNVASVQTPSPTAGDPTPATSSGGGGGCLAPSADNSLPMLSLLLLMLGVLGIRKRT